MNKYPCYLLVILLFLITQPQLAHAEDQERLMEVLEERLEKQVDQREKNNQINELDGQKTSYEEELEIIEQNITTLTTEIDRTLRGIKQTESRIELLERVEERIFDSLFINYYYHRTLGLINTQTEQSLIKVESIIYMFHEKKKLLVMLEDSLEEYESYIKILDDQKTLKSERQSKIIAIQEKEEQLHEELGELADADTILKNQELAIKVEMERERERRTGQSSSTYASSDPLTLSDNIKSHTGFIRPTTGSITSKYGPRATFGGRVHHGIDIGKNGRSGDVPVVAVQDGSVVRSYYSDSYGNTVILAHSINGKLVTTLYAHLEIRLVSDGQQVNQGQVLGNMGNTGRSFGAHLHFEVHEGGWNASKSNSVDPLKYIPK